MELSNSRFDALLKKKDVDFIADFYSGFLSISKCVMLFTRLKLALEATTDVLIVALRDAGNGAYL